MKFKIRIKEFIFKFIKKYIQRKVIQYIILYIYLSLNDTSNLLILGLNNETLKMLSFMALCFMYFYDYRCKEECLSNVNYLSKLTLEDFEKCKFHEISDDECQKIKKRMLINKCYAIPVG